MISALLVSVFALNSAYVTPPRMVAGDPPIRISLNHDRHFERGDRAKVEVRTENDGYLIVLHADPDGRLRVLFPLDPDDDNFVRGGKKYEIVGRGGRESFEVDVSSGKGAVYAAVSPDPLRFDPFVLGDHWDYKVLSASRPDRDAEPELNQLVQRMASGGFEYDLVTYDVYRRDQVAYGSTYAGPFYDSYYDSFCDPFYYGASCGSGYYGRSPFGLSLNFNFGRPYRRYYYDPYRYAYRTFRYDPFYYGGYPYSYYDPYYHRYRAPWRPYVYRGDYGRPIYYATQPSPRYRVRSLDDSPYRDRRYTLGQATNPVYGPIPSNVGRAPASSSSGTSGRRVLGGAAVPTPRSGSALAPAAQDDDHSRAPRRRTEGLGSAEPNRPVEVPVRRDEPDGGRRRELEPRREPPRAEPDRRMPERREPDRPRAEPSSRPSGGGFSQPSGGGGGGRRRSP